MKGTEKQIAWATEILERVIPVMDKALEFASPASRANWADMFAKVKAAEAAKIINCFKDFKPIGDDRTDAAELVKRLGSHQRVSAAQDRF